jgi:hypothetical protein
VFFPEGKWLNPAKSELKKATYDRLI